MRNAHFGMGVNGVISQFGRSLQISPAVLELLFAEQKMRDVNSAFRNPYFPLPSHHLNQGPQGIGHELRTSRRVEQR